MENFKVGDTVQWASAVNGFWKEKKGIVESVIPAGGNPQIYATRVAEKYGRKTPHLGYPRDHVSYIVRVPSKTDGVGKFYRPHVALLEKRGMTKWERRLTWAWVSFFVWKVWMVCVE